MTYADLIDRIITLLPLLYWFACMAFFLGAAGLLVWLFKWLDRHRPRHERGSEFQTRITRAKQYSYKQWPEGR